eukprot:GHVT01019220.1.p1 GENE.GHVT01019220.1~~GHVT01019220.1.p1  ORF type:complete len:131 (+),score=2.29 GHVT01019220.1:1146-1538(+)
MSNLCQIFACAINATELPESFLTSHATADEKLSHFIRCWKSRGRSVLPVQVLEQAQVILRYCEETVMPPSHSCRPLESFLLVLECSTVLFCVFNRKYRRVFAPAMNIKSGKELRVLWPCAVTNTNVNYNL